MQIIKQGQDWTLYVDNPSSKHKNEVWKEVWTGPKQRTLKGLKIYSESLILIRKSRIMLGLTESIRFQVFLQPAMYNIIIQTYV